MSDRLLIRGSKVRVLAGALSFFGATACQPVPHRAKSAATQGFASLALSLAHLVALCHSVPSNAKPCQKLGTTVGTIVGLSVLRSVGRQRATENHLRLNSRFLSQHPALFSKCCMHSSSQHNWLTWKQSVHCCVESIVTLSGRCDEHLGS